MSASVQVRVAGMDTQHAKRDAKMMKMLNQAEFSLIEGFVEDAPLPEQGSGPVNLRLTIGGTEQVVSAAVSDWNEDGEIPFVSPGLPGLPQGLRPEAAVGARSDPGG